tara:strand:- start:34 stop:837 length:804 start_codon:yes stop_codon:yes gene_type:complete
MKQTTTQQTISNDTLNLTSAFEIIQRLVAENKQLKAENKQLQDLKSEIQTDVKTAKKELEAIAENIKNPPILPQYTDGLDSDDSNSDSDDDDDYKFVKVNPDDYVNHYETNKKCNGADYGYKSSPAKIRLAKKNWIIYDKILDLQKYLKDYLTNYEFENQEVLPIRDIVFTVNRVNTEMTASLKTLKEEQKTLQQQCKELLFWRNEYALEEYKSLGESEWLEEVYGIPKVEDMGSCIGPNELHLNLDNYYYSLDDKLMKLFKDNLLL